MECGIMIRFVVGFCTIVAGVGAAEGSVGLETAIMLATIGIVIMFWGVPSMIKNGDMVS
jgi:hypothetical protein